MNRQDIVIKTHVLQTALHQIQSSVNAETRDTPLCLQDRRLDQLPEIAGNVWRLVIRPVQTPIELRAAALPPLPSCAPRITAFTCLAFPCFEPTAPELSTDVWSRRSKAALIGRFPGRSVSSAVL